MRPIDADMLIEKVRNKCLGECAYYEYSTKLHGFNCKLIANAPTITKEKESNMVEVVRCADCKNGHHIVNVVNGEVTVYRVFCKLTQAIHEPDWFCADRKGGK